MGWTKGQLVTEAYGELALAGHSADVTPEEQQTALRRLEAQMGTWLGKGINIGYRFAASPDAVDPDDDSGLPLVATETAFLHLAESLAAGFGRQLSSVTRSRARDGMARLEREAAKPTQQQQREGFPLGAGNKASPVGPYSPRFTTSPDRGPLLGPDGGLNFGS